MEEKVTIEVYHIFCKGKTPEGVSPTEPKPYLTIECSPRMFKEILEVILPMREHGERIDIY